MFLKISPLRVSINQIITYKIRNIFDVFPKKTTDNLIDVHAYQLLGGSGENNRP